MHWKSEVTSKLLSVEMVRVLLMHEQKLRPALRLCYVR